ncbi:MAG: iron chelate uptake ABC transporter family permease subunit [Verrucomicrobiota bacterium]|nr:iron chelate uptake ABC transporter family permease subunit [Verrucomicrobiota bacterium]
MPEIADIWNVLFLRDYNTRLVVLSTMLLGCACGLMGGFLLLRKRSLMGDTLSHATLPGVALAFMLAVVLGGDGKSLCFLLSGAAITGLLGCWVVLFICNNTRIKEDAAMGIVLSVSFGIGVALLGLIQNMPDGSAAGLESFIYGKTASMVLSDFRIILLVTLCVLACTLLLFKEFRLLCFDEGFAGALGWPVKYLDVLLLALVTAVTVTGLQAVGLILIISFLISPAAAARFWTNQLDRLLLLSALIGGLSAWIGVSLSAFFPRLPAGAVIVLVATTFFIVSMLAGSERGLLIRYLKLKKLKSRTGRQHLLRALYEILEGSRAEGELAPHSVPLIQLRERRTWTYHHLRTYIRRACKEGLIEVSNVNGSILLTEIGFEEAALITRNHRLWELYLIEYADVATSRVDRDADRVEHVLGEHIVKRLEGKLQTYKIAGSLVPDSPHPIVFGN